MSEIFITGASSYVGAGLYEKLAEKYEVAGSYNSNRLLNGLQKVDITNREAVIDILKRDRPRTIIHTAGEASLKNSQENPKKAITLNIEGTKNVIEAAREVGAGLIYISSFAALRTDNVYAQTKAESEKLIKSSLEKYIILRPTVVLGLSPNTKADKFFNRIIAALETGRESAFDNTWQIQPTYLGHMSQIIHLAINRNLTGKTIPVVTNKLKTYFQIANDILPVFGINVLPKTGPFYPSEKDSLQTLKNLGLPLMDYETIIENCIDEIKSYKLARQ